MALGGLLVGQLLHVQGHRPSLVALLIVFGDIHVPFRVPCVIGHPHSDRSTRNGYLEDKGDGAEKEKEKHQIWGLALAGIVGLRRGLGSVCIGSGAWQGVLKHVPVDLKLLRDTQGRVWREGPSSWPPPRSALPVPGPVPPCCSLQRAPPLPLRGGFPGLASHIELLADAILGVGGGRQ